jgi:RNA-directed DNA polymerase
MHQKVSEAVQLKLFTTTHGELHPAQDGGTVVERISRDELLSLLSRQLTLTNNLLERIVDYVNLIKASRRVVSNGGSIGIDGMETSALPQWLESNLSTLQTSLLEGSYEVSAVRKVEIPKPNGGKRTLGIPTVKDRLIQQAIHQELNRFYDPLFSTHSYGFRPGRSAHQAVLKASEYVKAGKEWVVDIDLEKFFDKINHDRLMQRLSKGIGDKTLLRLIRSYLTAGVMEGGLSTQRISGTPQGGPLSPLLSNVVLDELDKELESRGHDFCRYADDCNIFVGSKKAGERVMLSMIDFIENKLKLKVNLKKSGVRHCSEVKFLGYTLLEGGQIRVSDQSIERLKDTFRRITRRNRGVSFASIISELNTIIRGWSNYYRLANSWLTQFRELDSWLRRKLRCYRLKQCGRPYTIYKFLRSQGIKESSSWNVVMYSHGWWNMSKKEAVNRAMPNRWFFHLGLLSIFNNYEVTS